MIHFVGDINLTDWDFNVGFGIGSNIAKGFDPFKYITRLPDDLWIGNFEGVASSVSSKTGMGANVFRIDPVFLDKLNHFDFYGFANNHAMQHGDDAYRETVNALEGYGSKVFGSVERKSIVTEHQGKMVSLTGMSLRIDEFSKRPLYWHNPEYEGIIAELVSLPKDAYKILFVHWGNEYINRPSSTQKKFAHWLIDSGFDLIIGMHPHILQGYEIYKDKRIYYSVGNFVFDMPWVPCKIGVVIDVDFAEGEPIFRERYVKLDSKCCPNYIRENEVPEKLRFNYLNAVLLKEDNSEKYHSEMHTYYKIYRNANHKNILSKMIFHPSNAWGLIVDFIKRRFKIYNNVSSDTE